MHPVREAWKEEKITLNTCGFIYSGYNVAPARA